MSKPAGLLTLALASLVLTGWLSTRPAARVTGPAEVVFDWSEDRCASDDIPDLPARAFRDASGRVHLYASHTTTRRMTGSTLGDVRRDCTVVMSSHANPDPAAFDDQEWLASTYTFDGKTVFALVHNEFQGFRRPELCPSRDYLSCWYNALTLATSNDGGATFGHLPAPRHLVASLPTRYEPDNGPSGVFTPSNIVRNPKDGYLYALVRQIERRPDPEAGTCVMRTRTPGRPGTWRAWDGGGFNARFANPYRQRATGANACTTIFSGTDQHDFGQSLTWSTYFRRWLLVGHWGDGTGRHWFSFSLSTDFVNWTAPRPILRTKLPWTVACPGEAATRDAWAYPSLLDPAGSTRNFETVGRRAYLYFTRFNQPCGSGLDRDLLRVPVEFSK